MTAITHIPRVVAAVAALPIGAFCAVGAFASGTSQAGYVGGGAFASIVVSVWFIPAIIRTTTKGSAAVGRVLLLTGALFGMVNAIGFAASHRSEGVGGAQSAIAAYDRASAAFGRLERDLEASRRHPKKPGEDHQLWIRTAGCANATLPESEVYCAEVNRIRKDMALAKATLDKGRPLAADPQAESIKALTGLEPDAFNRWWPIAIAIVSEIFATGLMTLAFAPIVAPAQSKPAQIIEPVVEEIEVIVEPPVDWLCPHPPSAQPFPKLNPRLAHLTPLYRPDGRSLRGRMRRADNDLA